MNTRLRFLLYLLAVCCSLVACESRDNAGWPDTSEVLADVLETQSELQLADEEEDSDVPRLSFQFSDFHMGEWSESLSEIAVARLSGDRFLVVFSQCDKTTPTTCKIRASVLDEKAEELNQPEEIWSGGAVSRLECRTLDSDTAQVWWFVRDQEKEVTTLFWSAGAVEWAGINSFQFGIWDSVYDVGVLEPSGTFFVALHTGKEALLSQAQDPSGCTDSHNLLVQFPLQTADLEETTRLPDSNCIGDTFDCVEHTDWIFQETGTSIGFQDSSWFSLSIQTHFSAGGKCVHLLQMLGNIDTGQWQWEFLGLDQVTPFNGLDSGYVHLFDGMLCGGAYASWVDMEPLHADPTVPVFGHFSGPLIRSRDGIFDSHWNCGSAGAPIGKQCVGESMLWFARCPSTQAGHHNGATVLLYSNDKTELFERFELPQLEDATKVGIDCVDGEGCAIAWCCVARPVSC